MPSTPKKTTVSSIGSISNLAAALDISVDELEEARALSADGRYKKLEKPKANGKTRVVYNPHSLIRKIQSRINKRIFKKIIEWPPYIFGSVPNFEDESGDIIRRDYIACASLHCRAKSILKVDIEDFFENIHRDHVLAIFKGFFHYPDDVSELLTDLCCREDSLVQGALTSSYLASLCFWDLEDKVVKKLRRKKLCYTRLVDDITVSSKKSGYHFEYAHHAIREMLIARDLPLNDQKTKELYAGTEALEVHGLRVDFDEPRLPPGEVKNIRAAVHHVEKMAILNNYKTSKNYRRQYYRCLGRVNKLKRVGHDKHEMLLRRLRKIRPYPSKVEILAIQDKLAKLQKLYETHSSERWYKRDVDVTRYEASILARSFPQEAESILEQLRRIKPKLQEP